MNRRIRNKSYEEAKIRDILRLGKTQVGTQDTEAEIRDVPGITGHLASLCSVSYLAVLEIFGFKHIGVTTLPFRVM